MQHGIYQGLEQMPVVIEPETDGERSLDGLLDWCGERREWLDENLHTQGALLFRGCDISSPAAFMTANCRPALGQRSGRGSGSAARTPSTTSSGSRPSRKSTSACGP